MSIKKTGYCKKSFWIFFSIALGYSIYHYSRITKKSKNLVGNISFNSFKSKTHSWYIIYKIPYQLIQFFLVENFLSPSDEKDDSFNQNLKNVSSEKVKDELKVVCFGDTFNENENVNVVSEILYESLHDFLDRHAPLIQTTKKNFPFKWNLG